MLMILLVVWLLVTEVLPVGHVLRSAECDIRSPAIRLWAPAEQRVVTLGVVTPQDLAVTISASTQPAEVVPFVELIPREREPEQLVAAEQMAAAQISAALELGGTHLKGGGRSAVEYPGEHVGKQEQPVVKLCRADQRHFWMTDHLGESSRWFRLHPDWLQATNLCVLWGESVPVRCL